MNYIVNTCLDRTPSIPNNMEAVFMWQQQNLFMVHMVYTVAVDIYVDIVVDIGSGR